MTGSLAKKMILSEVIGIRIRRDGCVWVCVGAVGKFDGGRGKSLLKCPLRPSAADAPPWGRVVRPRRAQTSVSLVVVLNRPAVRCLGRCEDLCERFPGAVV